MSTPMSANLRMTEKYIRSCGAARECSGRVSTAAAAPGRPFCGAAALRRSARARAQARRARRTQLPTSAGNARLHGLRALVALDVFDAAEKREVR